MLRAASRVARLAGLVALFALLPPPAAAEEPEPPSRGASDAEAGGGEAQADAGDDPAEVEEDPADAQGDPADAPGDPADAQGDPAGTPAEKKKRRRLDAIETTNLEDPAFPTPRIRDAFRIRMQSRFVPAGNFDSFDVDLYRPELRLRATAPLNKRAVIQLTGRLGASLYDFDKGGDLLATGSRDSLSDFYTASLSLQGGVRLNESRSLFVEGEIWSLLAAIRGRSRWESGAFVDALTGNGTLAVGYETDDFRVAIGVQLGSRLDQGGIAVSPVANLKWEVTNRFTVRNRGQGLQLEYAFNKRFEVFVTSFLDSERFLLDSRPGLPDDITFRDRMVLAGLGFDWKISKHFRINVEAGAVPWRQIRVKSHDRGTLFKEQAEPGAYIDLRFEVRP